MEPSELIWMNGDLVAWEDAKVHVLTHGLHYGTGVFEGIRAYDTELGTAIFRHVDHLDRLFTSAGLYYMPIPYSREELRAATHELITRNSLHSCYIRPIVFRGYRRQATRSGASRSTRSASRPRRRGCRRTCSRSGSHRSGGARR